MGKLRIGIIGAGARGLLYGELLLTERFNREVEIIGLCDTNKVRAQSVMKMWDKDVNFYEDHRRMLEYKDIDAVIITTPDFTHDTIAVDSFEAGKDVLCEKPMTTTVEGARRMLQASKDNNKILHLGYVLRYEPLFIKLKDILNDNTFDRVITMNVLDAVQYRHGASYFRRWHRLRKYSGDLLFTKASHTIDIMNWIAGSQPTKVTAYGGINVFTQKNGVGQMCRNCSKASDCIYYFDLSNSKVHKSLYMDAESEDGYITDICVFNSEKDSCDNAVMLVEYENGLRASFTLSLIAPKKTRRFHVMGVLGEAIADFGSQSIDINMVDTDEHISYKFGSNRVGSYAASDIKLLDGFIECVKNRTAPKVGGEQGLTAVLMCAAALESMSTGTSVSLNEL